MPGPARDVAPPLPAPQPAMAGARTLPEHNAVTKHRRAGNAIEAWRARIA